MAHDRFRRFFRLPASRLTLDRDIDEELRFHVEERTAELIGEGLSPEAAAARAAAEFGDLAAARADLHDFGAAQLAARDRADLIDSARQNVKYALRGMRRRPGFSAAVILTFGLAICANTTMFGVLDRLLLSPPRHVQDPDGVVRPAMTGRNPRTGELVANNSFTYADYAALRGSVDALQDLAIAGTVVPRTATLGRDASATRVAVSGVSPAYFTILGLPVAAGRYFREDEDAVPHGSAVAVISHALWKQGFNGSADVIGRTVVVDTTHFAIIGVAPEGFAGLDLEGVDVWIPSLAFFGAYHVGAVQSVDPVKDYRGLRLLARMRDSEAIAAAEAEAGQVHARIAADRYARVPEARLALAPLIPGRNDGLFLPPEARMAVRVTLWLFGVTAVVMLIACANVTNLLLARTMTRTREFGVRLAMGAGRGRLTGLVMTECLLLALGGATLGLLLTLVSARIVRTVLLPGVTWPEGALGGRTVLFSLGLVVVAGVIAGLAPALLARRAMPATLLRSGDRHGTARRSAVRSTLVMAQSGLCALLLIGAGLFIRSLHNAGSVPLGMDTERLLYVSYDFRISLSLGEFNNTGHMLDAMNALGAMPGVESVAMAARPPWFLQPQPVFLERFGDEGGIPTRASVISVSEGYFRTVGTKVLRGRSFNAADFDMGALGRTVILSESAARALWPNEDAVGKCLQPLYGGVPGEPVGLCVQVAGVVQDTRQVSVGAPPVPAVYEPLLPGHMATIIARTRDDAATAIPALRRRLLAEQPASGAPEVSSVSSLVEPQLRAWRLGATLFGVFGGIALVLAALGLYSVVAYDVVQQRREVGVRMALGATRTHVLRLIMSGAVRMVAVGLAGGIMIALMLSERIEPLLFEVSPTDAHTFLAVGASLLLVALAAAIIPTLRALRISPSAALEAE